MSHPQPLTTGGRTYVSAVIVGGMVALAISISEIAVNPLGYQWYLLAALTLISGSATVNLPSFGISISVSETFIFFSVLLFGPAAGTVMVALDGLVISFWVAKRRPEWYRPLFNMAAPAVSFWIASHVLFSLAGISPLFLDRSSKPLPNTLVLPLGACAVIYFGLNSWLIAFAISFQRRISAYRVWRESSLLLSLNYFFGAAVALLLVVYTRDVNITFVAVIIPLLLVSYLTYRTTMGRLEDANRHLHQVNQLYMSTIETLAMAIDAKDQVTHGHIRRVQLYATRLAGEVGIRDESLIRAIEAAALLHDMGKLAVPEYILNKPGKLTAAEFERMKLHASVGADILSAIDFPYPVVPIVRHHHENWDGTGYPDRLSGTDIPIGARILSVVDCFDALTSDRPYRPKLRDEEALRILVERRGSMYDPLIVDTFSKVYPRIAPTEVHPKLPAQVLNRIATARQSVAPQLSAPILDEITASAEEMLTLYELARSLAGQVSVTDAADIITNHLRRLIPASLYVFFLWDGRFGDLEARHAIGEAADTVKGLKIGIGHRLSGWVAAHRQTISNSDPMLDLGDISRSAGLDVRSCLSTPLIADDDQLIGVVSLYARAVDAFNDDHCRILEVVARQIARTFRHAVEFEATPRRDPLTGLPNARQLEALVQSSLEESNTSGFALIRIDVVDLKNVNTVHGRATGDAALRHVVQIVQKELRMADILFRNTSDEFVAFLNRTDADTARTVAERIRTKSSEPTFRIGDAVLSVALDVSVSCAPRDGRSLSQLLSGARAPGGTTPRHGNVH
ncbi:MAG TPA: HD domain-containing phosphohydrolase [Vicinamibacterales bacterium]|nr:HD domain-containing phosphohydrolase [Vicinamibacterales bacterium]